MKAQMRFQKIICLVMILAGALALLYAFLYCSGSLANLGQCCIKTGNRVSLYWTATTEGKNDYYLYERIQPFNDMLMYFGIIMILLGVLLYITACQKRRNYYITNYVAIGLCAGGDIVMSLIALIMNGYWRSEFLNLDFEAWRNGRQAAQDLYSDSTLWFDIGFVVYALIIVAAVVLILNLVWKILLMKGEKQLLAGGGAQVKKGGVA